MSGITPDWLLALSPDDSQPRRVEPACSAVTVAVAAAVLGPGPVGWAVHTALRMTEEIIERVPEHGGGPGPFATLRQSIEASVLTALCGLADDRQALPELVPAEAIEGGGECARRGVPLDRVLRGVRIGHARLHRMLIAVIERQPEEIRAVESHRVSELLFSYADVHASRLAEEYLAERARWQAGREAEVRRCVEDLLEGREVKAEEASLTLGYELNRHHRAFVVSSEDRRDRGGHLRRWVEELGRSLGADGWLSVPAEPGEVWAWAGWRARPGEPDRGAVPGPPSGLRVCAGPVAFGPEGVRRSHLGARDAARIAAMAGADGWWDYARVRVAALATADLEHARWYAEEVLGPLLADDDRTRELRETLRVYLSAERSPQTAGERLHVARNTVTYRVRRAEELLGRPIGDPLELRLALEIARVLD